MTEADAPNRFQSALVRRVSNTLRSEDGRDVILWPKEEKNVGHSDKSLFSIPQYSILVQK